VYIRVNEPALSSFVELDRQGTGQPSASELVELAANALLAAGVLQWIGEDEQPEELPPDAQLEYRDGQLTLRSERVEVRTCQATELEARLLGSLAHQLAGTLNQRPLQGPWPKQLT
jgi:hypothetical protein